MNIQAFLSASLDRWRAHIERLRKIQELPAPWEVHPDIPRFAIGWRMGSGEDVMTDWQCWIHSLNLQQRTEYQSKHPEPEQWQGFYESVFSCDTGVPKDLAGAAYWDARLDLLRKKTEDPKLEAFYRELATLSNMSSSEAYKKFLALVDSYKKGKY